MTVSNVKVVEDKATELNFTLAPMVRETTGSTPVTTATVPPTTQPIIAATSPSNVTQTPVVPSNGNDTSSTVLPPVHQPIQPQEFRHHSYADMELFLRKYNSEFPSITYLHSIGRSVEERELYVMVISDNPTVHEHGMS